MGFIAMTA